MIKFSCFDRILSSMLRIQVKYVQFLQIFASGAEAFIIPSHSVVYWHWKENNTSSYNAKGQWNTDSVSGNVSKQTLIHIWSSSEMCVASCKAASNEFLENQPL